MVREIADWSPLETFENMQRMRTRLNELGEPSDLAASGMTKRVFRQLATLRDQSFDLAGRSQIWSTATGGVVDTERAVRLLRAADGFYRDGIRKSRTTQ
jgi:hypothetical protein